MVCSHQTSDRILGRVIISFRWPKMFAPTARTTSHQYQQYATIKWLHWLASNMMQDSQSVFHLERLQPYWLQLLTQVWIFRVAIGLIAASMATLIFGLFDIAFWPIIVAVVGLTVALVPKHSEIEAVKQVRFDVQSAQATFQNLASLTRIMPKVTDPNRLILSTPLLR